MRRYMGDPKTPNNQEIDRCVCPTTTEAYGARAMGSPVTHSGKTLAIYNIDCPTHGVPLDPVTHKPIDVTGAYQSLETRTGKQPDPPIIQGGV